MIRYDKLAPTEKDYPFEDAVTAADYKNGTFGTVAEGVFTAGTGLQVIMQVEDGEFAGTDSFVIKKGDHARVADLSRSEGAIVDITFDNITDDYASAKYFEVDSSTGLLKKADDLTSKDGFTVIEGTDYGFRAIVTLQAES